MRSTKREQHSTSCGAPSGTSPRPKPSSGLLSGCQGRLPLKIALDGYQASHRAAKEALDEHPEGNQCEIRSSKYLNNLIEQDHRSVKFRLGPMLGLKHFRQAATTIAGIELMHRIRKGQFKLGRLGTKGNTAPKTECGPRCVISATSRRLLGSTSKRLHHNHLWRRAPPFDHSKLMTIDGSWSLIGSANWDMRSLRLNFELTVEFYDTDLAGKLAGMIDARCARPITLEEIDKRPLPVKLRDAAARLAMPCIKESRSLLKVASYNIHRCRGVDGATRPERIIGVIRELGADVIALQEVDRRFGRGGGLLDPSAIARGNRNAASGAIGRFSPPRLARQRAAGARRTNILQARA